MRSQILLTGLVVVFAMLGAAHPYVSIANGADGDQKDPRTLVSKLAAAVQQQDRQAKNDAINNIAGAAFQLRLKGTPQPPAFEEAVPLLTRALSDEDWGVRVNAAMALGSIGAAAKPALPRLRELASREVRPDARYTMRREIERIEHPLVGEAEGQRMTRRIAERKKEEEQAPPCESPARRVRMSGAQLTDTAAARVIEKLSNAPENVVPLPLGEVTIVGGLLAGAPKKGQITPEGYRILQAWSRVGIVTILGDKEWDKFQEGKTFSWDKYLQAAQGTSGKVYVAATDKGYSLQQQKLPENPGCLFMPVGTFRVTKIIRNQPLRASGEDFQHVLMLHEAAFDATVKQLAVVTGRSLSPKRKARMLLKYDPFAESWSEAAMDDADADGQFDTENVPTALSRLQMDEGKTRKR